MSYILDEHYNVVVESDPLVWSKWFKNTDRRTVAKWTAPNGLRVSTVFLGLDHNFDGDGAPLVFETMVFPADSYHDLYVDRCSTWDEAVKMHEKAVTAVKAGEVKA